MKYATILAALIASTITSCEIQQDTTRHQAIFRHYATGTPLPGIPVRVDKFIIDLSDPFGYTEFYQNMTTDDRGALSFDAPGSYVYTVMTDTLRGPLPNYSYGGQGVSRNGILTINLYPYTRLALTNSIGDYKFGEVTVKPQEGIDNYPEKDSSWLLITPADVGKYKLPLLTHRTNRVHMNITLNDGTAKTFDTTITPVNFNPVILNVPF